MADLTADQSKYAAALGDLNRTLVLAVQTGNTVAAAELRQQIQATIQLYVQASQAAIAAEGPSQVLVTLQNLDDAVGGAVSTVSTGIAGLVGDSALAVLKPLAVPLILLAVGIIAFVWFAGKSGALRIQKVV